MDGIYNLRCCQVSDDPDQEGITHSKMGSPGEVHHIAMLTGQFADKPTCGHSSRGLDNSRTSKLADSEFLKIMELLYFICTLNLTIMAVSHRRELFMQIRIHTHVSD